MRLARCYPMHCDRHDRLCSVRVSRAALDRVSGWCVCSRAPSLDPPPCWLPLAFQSGRAPFWSRWAWSALSCAARACNACDLSGTELAAMLAMDGESGWAPRCRVRVLVWTPPSVRHQHTRGAPGAKWASLDMRLKVPVLQLSKVLHVKFAGGGLDGPAGSPRRTGHGAVSSPPRNARAALYFTRLCLTKLCETVWSPSRNSVLRKAL